MPRLVPLRRINPWSDQTTVRVSSLSLPERQNLPPKALVWPSFLILVRRDNTCDHVEQSRRNDVDGTVQLVSYRPGCAASKGPCTSWNHYRQRFAKRPEYGSSRDSPLEGSGFELSVPRPRNDRCRAFWHRTGFCFARRGREPDSTPGPPIRPGGFQRRFRFPHRDGALDGYRPAAAIGLPSAVSDRHHPSPWAPNHQRAAGVLDPPQAW
jgi:hypothetical protein